MANATDTAVERELVIAAKPETVWELLVDPAKTSAWMGMQSWSDPKPGGQRSAHQVMMRRCSRACSCCSADLPQPPSSARSASVTTSERAFFTVEAPVRLPSYPSAPDLARQPARARDALP